MKLIPNMKVCNAKVIVEIIVTAVVGAEALLVERPDIMTCAERVKHI